jgi:gliding motility-associated-like protein
MKCYLIQLVSSVGKSFPLFLFILCSLKGQGQTGPRIQPQRPDRRFSPENGTITRFVTHANNDLFGKSKSFIENVGQYGDTLAGHGSLGKIRYGFEGLEMPLLFTPKGVIYMQSKAKSLTHAEMEALERKGMREEEIARKRIVTNRVISMEWVDGNPNPYIIADDQLSAYYTYGSLPRRARAYKTILYKQVYPGIDILFSFVDNRQAGVEYSIIVRPGADISRINIRFGGNTKRIKRGRTGSLLIASDIDGFTQSSPVCYYGDPVSTDRKSSIQPDHPIVQSMVKNNVLSFVLPASYRADRTLVIDPFISSTGNLTGTFAGRAKDVNFDYAGNIYVAGGGSQAQYELAKYDPSGALIWTFSGSVPGIPYPGWAFGQLYGGWTVEKNTGYTYLGQGIAALGAQMVRLDPNGQYDNFITNRNPSLLEMWKLFWYCNNGQPQIITCGGSTSSNDNFGVVTPPATNLVPINLTGRPDDNINGGCCQDISDIAVDPKTNEIYVYFNSLYVPGNGGTTGLDNHIYKFSPPYSAASILWNTASGYQVMGEGYNRPYMGGVYPYTTDNSANVLAQNSSWLFYWDGVHLQAYDKSSGAPVGTPLSVTGNQPLYSGGIYADECNHVFVGSTNGTIKVYSFNGSTFDDAASTDISITGYPTSSVYSLAYDNARQLLYASGDGFVAAFDISAYCPSQAYKVQVNAVCSDNSAKASISPSPPAGSTVNYILFNGSSQLATNTNGQFAGLQVGVTYTVKAIVNEGCSGIAISTPFSMPQISVSATTSPASCGNSNGDISALAASGASPYSYSMDGLHFQPTGSFSALAAGTYTVSAKDANGCTGDIRIAITNQDGPILTVQKTDATCGNSTGTITASAIGGNGTILFSIDGVNFQSGGTFTGLAGGHYTITTKDASGCTNSQPEDIVYAASTPSLFGSVTDAICNVQQGSILAQATGGTAPYQYSVNNQPFQSSSVFPGLAAGNYHLVVQDANGCTANVQETIQEICIFSVSAISTNAECGAYDGSISASVVNGTAPFTYSIDGIHFYSSNIFPNLQQGLYTVTAKDVNGTIVTTMVLVGVSCPTVSVSVIGASCGNQNGSVAATPMNGTGPYQYSLDGIHFQASNIFTGLAPGVYTVTMEDAKGFYATASGTVYNSCPYVTVLATDASCGLNNGKITAAGSNGTAPYQYSIDGTNFQSSSLFQNLAPGSYTVTVMDALSAQSTANAVINNTPGPQVTASATNASCKNDDGSITATGSGGTGSLLYGLDGTHFQSSNVFPNLSSNAYVVYVQDGIGCVSTIPVAVPFTNSLTLQVEGPDTICEGTKTTLIIHTNASSFSWTPSDGLNDAALEAPVASPTTTATYFVTVSTGPCSQTGSVRVIVNPAPIASVSRDTTVCYGGKAQLSGSGGVSFAWSPPDFLNDMNSPDPIALAMTASTAYTLVVSDALGCSSIVPAVVQVQVTPPARVFAGDDTAIHVNHSLVLDAVDVNNSGFKNYQWSPAYGLNDPSSKDPVATITQNITYTVLAITAAGCRAMDTISIEAYALSDIFVPSGFTPNGDGHNDILRPVLIGVRYLKYFALFNRWGQRVFYTTDPKSGWNGMLNGVPQNAGTYVWATEGVDYLGNTITKKGTTVLIR